VIFDLHDGAIVPEDLSRWLWGRSSLFGGGAGRDRLVSAGRLEARRGNTPVGVLYPWGVRWIRRSGGCGGSRMLPIRLKVCSFVRRYGF
jgi:hypothetical protein